MVIFSTQVSKHAIHRAGRKEATAMRNIFRSQWKWKMTMELWKLAIHSLLKKGSTILGWLGRL